METKNSVLIVDDDAPSIALLGHLLSPEYTVYATKDGRNALDMAKKYVPDLILLDILMPMMDGYAVLAQLKASPKTWAIPVILITGLDSVGDEEKGFALGAADYIRKPFGSPIVKMRVRNQMQIVNQLRQIQKLREAEAIEYRSKERELNERIELMFNTAPMMIQYWDADHSWGVCNQMTLDFYGFATQEEYRAKLKDVVLETQLNGAQKWKEWNEYLDKIFRDGHAVMANWDLENANGERVSLEVAGFRMKYSDGSAVAATYATDVTQLRLAMAQEREALEKARAAVFAKSRFLSNMSHEIHTPITAITGMAAIGKSADDTEKKDYAFAKIEAASNHLIGIVSDVLDMSNIEQNKLELRPTEFNFERLINEAADIIRLSVNKKNQRLTVSWDSNIPECLVGDDRRLSQVIMNLLSNAVKFTPERGNITLNAKLMSMESGGGHCDIQVEVIDTGIGIIKEKLEQLFNAFEQEDNSASRRYSGMGLGLTISKHVIKLMGGDIWAESQPGNGTKFAFNVPLAYSAEPGAPANVKESGGQEPPAAILNGRRVLLCEDIEINREIVTSILESMGIETDCAVNGEEAVEAVAANPGYYDLIFMDIQMPLMDGLEATRRIRALPAGSLPIIALTANVSAEDSKTCLAAGMDDHISKPIDQQLMFEKLYKYLCK